MGGLLVTWLMLAAIACAALRAARFMWSTCGCCGCDPTTTKVSVQPTSRCGAVAVNGATVTVKDSHGTTVGTCTVSSGSCCVGVSKKDTYTITVTASGFCDATTTVVISSCGSTHNVPVTMNPLAIPATFSAGLCCDNDPGLGVGRCCPTASIPVTVSVTQTVGGTFTNTCTLTSCSGCVIDLPAPCPPSSSNVFSVTWSATGFTSQARTVTVTSSTCSTGVNVVLVNSSSNYCYSGSDCIDSIPTSLTVTLHILGFACNGTYTVPLDTGLTPNCTPSYRGTFSCTGPFTVTISVSGSIGAGCTVPTSRFVNVSTSPAGLPVPGALMILSSGTAACPVSFAASDAGGNTCTVSE